MVIQILGILLARYYGGQTSSFSWSRLQWGQPNGNDRSTSRPLLTGQESQVEEVDEEIGPRGPDDPRYGTLETNPGPGPAILPSGLQPHYNEWREEQ